MYSDQHIVLCERIRNHCQQQQWYGLDMEGPNSRGRFVPVYDPLGELLEVVDMEHHPRRRQFEFPPATEEQLAATEDALGYPLPAMLRALYALVANGGFGPGFGILGAQGGYHLDAPGYGTVEGTVDTCADKGNTEQYFNLAEYEATHGMPKHMLLPLDKWPSRFLHLVLWGCQGSSFLDANSGHVYFVDLWDYIEAESGPPTYIDHLYRQEKSLEDWLETWLRHDWKPPHLVPPQWFAHESDPPVKVELGSPCEDAESPQIRS